MPFIHEDSRTLDNDRGLELKTSWSRDRVKKFWFHRVGDPDDLCSQRVVYGAYRFKISDIALTEAERQELPDTVDYICSYQIGGKLVFDHALDGCRLEQTNLHFDTMIDGYSLEETKQIIIEAFIARERGSKIHKVSHYDFYFAPDRAPEDRTF